MPSMSLIPPPQGGGGGGDGGDRSPREGEGPLVYHRSAARIQAQYREHRHRVILRDVRQAGSEQQQRAQKERAAKKRLERELREARERVDALQLRVLGSGGSGGDFSDEPRQQLEAQAAAHTIQGGFRDMRHRRALRDVRRTCAAQQQAHAASSPCATCAALSQHGGDRAAGFERAAQTVGALAEALQAREKQIAQLTQQLEQACRERDARAASTQATPAEHAEIQSRLDAAEDALLQRRNQLGAFGERVSEIETVVAKSAPPPIVAEEKAEEEEEEEEEPDELDIYARRSLEPGGADTAPPSRSSPLHSSRSSRSSSPSVSSVNGGAEDGHNSSFEEPAGFEAAQSLYPSGGASPRATTPPIAAPAGMGMVPNRTEDCDYLGLGASQTAAAPPERSATPPGLGPPPAGVEAPKASVAPPPFFEALRSPHR